VATAAPIGKSDVMGRDGFTWWLGEVESIKDPQMLGRVKVRIVGWYTGTGGQSYLDQIPTEDLPWAVVMLPTDQAGIKNTGTKTELQVGAQVLGFFLDGEEAQLPVVMGSLRGFRGQSDPKQGDDSATSEEGISATTIADNTEALTEEEMPETAKDIKGQVVNQGNSFVVDGSVTPGDENGGEEKSNGVLSILEQESNGNVYTNPTGVPPDVQGIGNGVVGPSGEGFEKDLNRMLTEFGQLSGTLGRDLNGNLTSLITGKKVFNDVVNESLAGIKNYVSSAMSGIMSSLKQMLAKQIESLMSSILGAISNVVPTGVISSIMKLADFITNLFCSFEGKFILGQLQSAMSDISGFAEDIAGKVVDKVVGGFADKVTDTVNGVLSKIQNGISKVSSVANTITSAIGVAQKAAGVARKVSGSLNTLFEFDFSKLDFASIVSIIMGIIAALFGNKDCGRSIKQPKQKFWLPLLGTSTCESVPEFLMQEVTLYGGGSVGKPKPKSKGDYFKSLMKDIDVYAVKAETFLNGAKTIQDNTPGKEKTIVQHAGGQTVIATALGDQHTNVPGNDTKIIGRDECKTIKKNKTLTVEGDFTLKVMGDLNLEVGGAMNTHLSQNVETGEDGAPVSGAKQSKTAQTFSSDYNVAYEGDYQIQAANIKLNAHNEISFNASAINNKCATLMNTVSGEIINEAAWKSEFINNVIFQNVGALNPMPGLTGRCTMIKGLDLTICGSGGGTSALPAAHVRIAECTGQPGGMVDLVSGTAGGHLTLVKTPKGGIGEFVTGAGGGILNTVSNGVATYTVGTGVFTAGCTGGLAQFVGLPIMLN
tara:strand:- start:7931 stop:10393 length:2463 start_codon:yes stop_codon:yes gene_type:complete